jgi:prepilin-type N-terminal cleavage/methylation domain-containing protein
MRNHSPYARRGMTLLEVGVALVILATAMVALVQLLSLSARQRRVDDQRSLALLELANHAEELAVIPWNELTPENLAKWQPPAELVALLPSARCHAEVHEEEGPPAARRIGLQIVWTNAVGEEVAPVELTLWRHAPEAPR